VLDLEQAERVGREKGIRRARVGEEH
jgi:hypothetical protein